MDTTFINQIVNSASNVITNFLMYLLNHIVLIGILVLLYFVCVYLFRRLRRKQLNKRSNTI